MSGTRPNPGERRVADQHLGDRLSALVDGELGHDARERVLAHLATCARCKAEADAQRRLKSVFAEAAQPSPSESFLARLQGLPGGADSDSGSPLGPFGGRLPGGSAASGFAGGSGAFGMTGESFGYVPSGPHSGRLTPSDERRMFGVRGLLGDRGSSGGRGLFGDRGSVGGRSPLDDRLPSGTGAYAVDGNGTDLGGEFGDPDDGFRIHPVGRQEATERTGWRGLRFAFAAAGAVSLAAIALGGVTTGGTGDTTEARGQGAGSNVTPARTPATGATGTPDSQRRRAFLGPLLGQGQTLGEAPLAPTEVSAPLLPGVPAPVGPPARAHSAVHPLTNPVVAGAAAMSPLIRPLPAARPVTSASWPTTPNLVAPGLLVAPGASSAPGGASPKFP